MRKLLLAISLILLTAAPLGASDVREYKLDNGLKVLIMEDHKAPLAVFQIWYRVGARDEVSGRTGLSHLLEHMMFKGTAKYGSKEFSRIIQKNGGSDNAFTSKDYTAYHQTLSSDRLHLSLELESDRMRGLILKDKDVLSERDVVMEERRLRYEDDPQRSLHEEVVAAAFKVHPYGRPVIGWMQDLGSIQGDDLAEHYKDYYSPSNATIVVVGDVEPDELIKEIKIKFGAIKATPQPRSHASAEPPQRGERRVTLRREAELPHIMAVYHAPNLLHVDGYALDVLSMVLDGGKSARFYKSLVYERKLAIDAHANYGGSYRDPYLFTISATASPGTGAPELESALLAEVEKIKDASPGEFELLKAKNQIEAEFVMDRDSLFYQALILGIFETMGDWKIRDSYIEGIRKVTAADVSRVARKYLAADNRTLGVLVPLVPKKQGDKE